MCRPTVYLRLKSVQTFTAAPPTTFKQFVQVFAKDTSAAVKVFVTIAK